jgi:predicted transcriptional regulator
VKTTEEKKRFTIYAEPEVMHRIKIVAAIQKTTITAIIEEALTSILEKYEAPGLL